MKLVLICLIFITGISLKASDKTYSATGHDQFSEITFVDDNCFLIKDLDQSTINSDLKSIKNKFIGTSEKTYLDNVDATFVSTTIFSRSNKTREEYTFVYDTSSVTYKTISVSIKGTISSKVALKDKDSGLEASVGGDLTGTYSVEDKYKYTENGKLSVVVYPYKKMTLRIVGECKISSGVSKYCFFGIPFKKGAWEVITVISSCYELIEEDI